MARGMAEVGNADTGPGGITTSLAARSRQAVAHQRGTFGHALLTSLWKGESEVILVTGAAGFIGSHVLNSLIDGGIDAVGLDIAVWDKKLTQQPLTRADGRISYCDIRNSEALMSLVQFLKPDAVIHLAARVGVRDSLSDPRGYLETNVIGTQNLLDACQKAGVKQVVLASTSSVYGDAGRTAGYQSEAMPPEPRSPYAASKLSMEVLGYVNHRLYGMNVIALRLFSVYGERIRSDLMISQIMHSITTGEPITLFNNGEMYRDWTYIGDVVNGIRAALTLEGCETINIGHGWAVHLKALVQTLERISGGKANVNYAKAPITEPLSTQAEISKAKRLLGYQPKVDIEEGLLRTWAWYETAHSLRELEAPQHQEQAGEFRMYGKDWVTRKDVQIIVLEELSRLDE